MTPGVPSFLQNMIANCRMNLWLLRSVRGHRKPRDPSNFRGLVQRRKCRISKKACDSPCRFDPSHTCMSLPKPYFSESARIKSGVTVLGDLLRTIMAGGCQIEFSWRMGAKKRKGWHLTGPLRIVHCSLQPCVGTYDLIGGPETRLSGSETLADSDCYDESECFVRCRSLWHCSRAWMAQKKAHFGAHARTVSESESIKSGIWDAFDSAKKVGWRPGNSRGR